MALQSGTQLGAYRIVGPLGAGGMGEVYLAQDTRLDRKVALKLLPAEVASNQDRMRRFIAMHDSRRMGIMNADGTGSRQLTADTNLKGSPAVSHDGNHVFFTSFQSGTPHIWRINADGSNLKQITSGDFTDYTPTCSPDGQWITFMSTRSGNSCLWKVSVDGGEPVQLTDKPATRAFFSTDGKLIACGYFVQSVYTTSRYRGTANASLYHAAIQLSMWC